MDLYRACVARRLFKIASVFLEIKEGQRLLGNPYPLSEILDVDEVVEGQERTGMGNGGRDTTNKDIGDADKSL